MMIINFFKKYLFCILIFSLELLLIILDKISDWTNSNDFFNYLSDQYIILILLMVFMQYYLVFLIKRKYPDFYPGGFMSRDKIYNTIYNKKLQKPDIVIYRKILGNIIFCLVSTIILVIIVAFLLS